MVLNSTALNWHVVYTRPKCEKKVASTVEEMGIEVYLPLCKTVRQWSDRKRKVEVPLFPNYLFIKVEDNKRGHLFAVGGLRGFVCIERKPVVVREKEILTIKRALSSPFDVAPEDFYQNGMRVKIAFGPFAGLEGFIIKRESNLRLVVRVEGLMRAFSIRVAAGQLTSIEQLSDSFSGIHR